MAGKSRQNFTAKKKAAFLTAYVECGTITHAVRAAKVSRQTHYVWLKKDPEYARDFAEAEQAAGEMLEREARRRAIEGVQEPIVYQGKVTATKLVYSDVLLMFLLKGAMPEKYRERQEIRGEINIRDITERLEAGRKRLAEGRD